MKLPLALFVLFLVSTAAIAADTKPAKPKPCLKGQVATTSEITGEQACFAMQIITAPGHAEPVDTTAKPKPKPKPN